MTINGTKFKNLKLVPSHKHRYAEGETLEAGLFAQPITGNKQAA